MENLAQVVVDVPAQIPKHRLATTYLQVVKETEKENFNSSSNVFNPFVS